MKRLIVTVKQYLVALGCLGWSLAFSSAFQNLSDKSNKPLYGATMKKPGSPVQIQLADASGDFSSIVVTGATMMNEYLIK